MVIAPLAGRFSGRLGLRPVIVTGLDDARRRLHLGCARGVAPSELPRCSSSRCCIAGVGVSMTIPTVPAAVFGAVDPSEMGAASGTNNMLQRFGAVLGVALTSSVFSAYGAIGSPASFTDGFRPGVAVAAALALARRACRARRRDTAGRESEADRAGCTTRRRSGVTTNSSHYQTGELTMADILHRISIDAEPELSASLSRPSKASRTGGPRIRSAAPTGSAAACSSTSAAATRAAVMEVIEDTSERVVWRCRRRTERLEGNRDQLPARPDRPTEERRCSSLMPAGASRATSWRTAAPTGART